ncbi:MAG: hypothetical protein M3Q99_06305 [Acidobacteriota bacterium]|nr:hypothetical protein [Acidobacteriota bacterium]
MNITIEFGRKKPELKNLKLSFNFSLASINLFVLRISRAVSQTVSAFPLDSLPKLQSPANAKSFEIINIDVQPAVYSAAKLYLKIRLLCKMPKPEAFFQLLRRETNNEKRDV